MMNGILLFDKPKGMTSNFALQKVRRALGVDKAGHSGTLDPMATGLLPIGVGHGTKALAYLLDADKRYVTTVRLGVTTTTGDAEGEVLEVKPVPSISESLLQGVLSHFRGNIQQIPHMYSAVKHQGVRLYQLAREGQTVERVSRQVTILSCDLLSFTDNELSLQVWCSKGTYIRTLAEDIGEMLGCGAHLVSLRRIGVAGFDTVLTGQVGIDYWCQWKDTDQSELARHLLPIDAVLGHYARLILSRDILVRLVQGQKISANDLEKPIEEKDLIRLYDDQDTFYGLGKATPFQGLMIERWMSDKL